MSFAADAQAGEQRVVVQIPSTGTSKHGKSVNLQNVRLELTDPADSDKATVAAHEDGTAGKFTVVAADALDVTTPVPVNVVARADGDPGDGDVELEEPGIVTFRSATAAAIGTVSATTEDLP